MVDVCRYLNVVRVLHLAFYYMSCGNFVDGLKRVCVLVFPVQRQELNLSRNGLWLRNVCAMPWPSCSVRTFLLRVRAIYEDWFSCKKNQRFSVIDPITIRSESGEILTLAPVQVQRKIRYCITNIRTVCVGIDTISGSMEKGTEGEGTRLR